jgi:glycosyltransferase involved in cell wall biosynthesis
MRGTDDPVVMNSSLLRLCFVSHRFRRNDGQGRVNYEVVKEALTRGMRVTVLATDCAPELAEHPLCRFVPVGTDRAPTELVRNLIFAFESTRWLKRHAAEFDIIQANGFVTWQRADVVAAHFIHSAWAKNRWYPFRSLKPYDLYQRTYTKLNARWEQTAFTRAKLVIAVSGGLVADLVAMGVPGERIRIVMNGVDTDQFAPGPANRAHFGLPLDGSMGLFIGDIRTSRKNLETVLKALCDVPTLRLAVAGPTAGSPYPSMARDLGIDDRVHFLGKVTEVPSLMRSVDLFIFPSRYEAHPLVLLEAMASGVPSVVSNTFGAEEFLGSGGIILSDPNDAQALSVKLLELLEDPALRNRMGVAARRQAEQMQWSHMAARYMEIYREIAAENFTQAPQKT